MMKTLLNTLFYFVNPDIKLKNKIAAGWLLFVVCAILGVLGFALVDLVYGAHGLVGVLGTAAGIVASVFTIWALTTWLNEG